MRIGEPLRALIVEVGERALLEFFGSVRVLRQYAVGVSGNDLGLDANEVRRIEPIAAKVVEFFSPLLRCGWRGNQRRNRRPEYSASGPREKGRSRKWWSGCSAGDLRARSQAAATRPRESAMENAERRIVVAGDGIAEICD